METVVSARSMIPNLYGDESKVINRNNEYDDENENDNESTNHEDIVDDLTYDVYNLTACNYHSLPIDYGSSNESKEEIFLNLTARSAQLLVKRIFECPLEKSEVGPLAVLPVEEFVLPREKPVPQPKPETKWEKFAKEKGIKKQKRDRMIFDESSNEWKPRYGYKSIKDGMEDVPIIEVKQGQNPYSDPWEENRKAKKEKIAKNLRNQERNILKKNGGKYKKYDPSIIPGIPLDVEDTSQKRGKEGIRKALQLVQHSTQSLGRFDEMRRGEPQRKIKGKKRNFRDNLQIDDREEMKAQLRIVEDKISKKARGVTNSLKAYEGLIPDAPSFEFKSKKGKGKSTKAEKNTKSNDQRSRFHRKT